VYSKRIKKTYKKRFLARKTEDILLSSRNSIWLFLSSSWPPPGWNNFNDFFGAVPYCLG